jgi:uncharacterized membrane-anchored protein
MAQAHKDGGLGLGTTGTSLIFLATILVLVTYLGISKVDQTPVEKAHEDPHDEPAPVDA